MLRIESSPLEITTISPVGFYSLLPGIRSSSASQLYFLLLTVFGLGCVSVSVSVCVVAIRNEAKAKKAS